MARKYTQEEVAQYFKEQGYELLSEYKGSGKKVKIRNATGGEYETRLNDFRRGKRPELRNFKFTQEEVTQYFKDQGYELLSEYTNSDAKVEVKNSKGDVYETTLSSFKRGSRPERGRAKFTQEEVTQYFKGQGYELLSEYAGANEHVYIRNKDGVEYRVRFGDFYYQGRRPERRSYKGNVNRSVTKHTYETISSEVSPYGYKLLSFVNSNKITLETPSGYIWNTQLKNFKRGRRHPLERTGSSRGETIIYNILRYSGIDFRYQYPVTIKGNKHIFDFYLPELGTIIEYNGVQHYKEVPMFGELSDRQARDIDKKQWAYSKGYKFISIPYTLTSPESITSHLKRYVVGVGDYNSEYLYFSSIMGGYNRVDIANYYLTHSMEDTCVRYSITDKFLISIFKYHFGSNKRAYLLREATIYYATHTLSETLSKYNVTSQSLQKSFKKEHGITRKEYVKKNNSYYTKGQAEVAYYFLSHTANEAKRKWGLGTNTILRWFKRVYGMTKTEYLKQHPELKEQQAS